MLILAIDTALDACAAAVLDTGTGKLIAMESQAMKRGHAEALMPLIARVMKESGLPFAALDRIAVTTGPGSFTGLRVGLSRRIDGRSGLLRLVLCGERQHQPAPERDDRNPQPLHFRAISWMGSRTDSGRNHRFRPWDS